MVQLGLGEIERHEATTARREVRRPVRRLTIRGNSKPKEMHQRKIGATDNTGLTLMCVEFLGGTEVLCVADGANEILVELPGVTVPA